MDRIAASSRWLWIAGVALLVAGGAAWFGARGTEVEAVSVRHAPLVRTLQFSARVATLSRVEVGSTVTGRVAQVLVREGEQVQAGQVLVRLEDDEAGAALAQAQATQRQAQARLGGLRTTGRAAALAQLGQAEATLTAARAELRRVEQLVSQGFVSGSQRDDARRVLQVAEAQRAATLAQTQAIEERGTEVAQAEAALQAARAATTAAQARLAQAALRAPAAAHVLSRLVEPGQIVQPGKALVGLALAGPTQIEAQVDERFLEQLRVGQKATVVADAFAERRLAATVLTIAPAVDAQRGAVEVQLALQAPPPDFLREDMTLSVEVETGRAERALVLPARALRAGGSGDQVLVAQDGRAVERRVRIGLRTLDAAEVLDGLREGELVLLAPALAPGARVRVRAVPWAPARSPLAQGGGKSDATSDLTQAMGR